MTLLLLVETRDPHEYSRPISRRLNVLAVWVHPYKIHDLRNFTFNCQICRKSESLTDCVYSFKLALYVLPKSGLVMSSHPWCERLPCSRIWTSEVSSLLVLCSKLYGSSSLMSSWYVLVGSEVVKLVGHFWTFWRKWTNSHLRHYRSHVYTFVALLSILRLTILSINHLGDKAHTFLSVECIIS